MHYTCGTRLLAETTTDTFTLVNHGVTTMTDTDGVTRTHIHTNTTRDTTVTLVRRNEAPSRFLIHFRHNHIKL